MNHNKYIDMLLENIDFKKRMLEINDKHPSSWGGITATNTGEELPYSFVSGKFIHFTYKNTDAIIENGIHGVRYMNDIMMNIPTKENNIDIGEDVIFAYHIDYLNNAGFKSAIKTYGGNAIIFDATDALEIFSPIDADFEYLVAVSNIKNPISIANISWNEFVKFRS